MEKNDKKSTLYSEVPGISIQECSFILDIIRGDITFPLKKKIWSIFDIQYYTGSMCAM